MAIGRLAVDKPRVFRDCRDFANCTARVNAEGGYCLLNLPKTGVVNAEDLCFAFGLGLYCVGLLEFSFVNGIGPLVPFFSLNGCANGT